MLLDINREGDVSLPTLCKAPVAERLFVAPGVFRLTFIAAKIAQRAQPGQFVHLRVGPALDPLLRRPFGIHSVDQVDGTVTILIQVVGRGTSLLAATRPGDELDVLGPLGRGFSLPAPGLPVALVAGGLGIAPLAFLLNVLDSAGVNATIFQGARNAALLLKLQAIPSRFERRCATDDGSAGRFGSVVDLFTESLDSGDNYGYVYAAGPYPMLKALAVTMLRRGIDGEVSLEERMACGVGACLCCSVALTGPSTPRYARACADGPVFRVSEVAWQ